MKASRLKTLGLLLGGAVTGVVAMQAFNVADAASNAETYKLLNLFGDVYDRVRADYVEEPDEKKMIEAAINGMLMSLDPHSSYMDADSFEDMSVKTKGEFGGLGIEVTMENGVVKGMAPYDGTPASKAGILQRPDRRHRQEGSAGPDPERGGGQDAWCRGNARHPHHPARQAGAL